MVAGGRYAAPSEKLSRHPFRPDTQEGQFSSLDAKKPFQWGWKYKTTILYQDSSVLLNWPKISNWRDYALLNLRLGAGFTDIVHHYGGKLSQAETTAEKYEVERTLSEASDNREVIAALIEHGGLGLQLLAHLRAYGKVRLSEFVSKMPADLDDAASVVARLVQGGVVIVDDVSFVCTDRGLNILQNLERNSGVNLTPEC